MSKRVSVLELIKRGDFVVSAQIDPPGLARDANSSIQKNEQLLLAISALRETGITILDVNSSRRISHDSVQLSAEFSRMGFTVIPHITTRDSSPNGVLNKVLAAHAWNEISSFLIVTGDPYEALQAVVPNGGVFQADSVKMINILNSHLRGDTYTRSDITLAAAISQNENDLAREGTRVVEKVTAGTDFFMSQPVFDESQLKRLVGFYKTHSSLPLIVGIWPLINRKTIQTLQDDAVVGVKLPEKIYAASLEINDKELSEWGIEHAFRLVQLAKENPSVHGAYVVTPTRNPISVLPLFKKIG